MAIGFVPIVLEAAWPMAEVERRVYLNAAYCLDDDAGPGKCIDYYDGSVGQEKKRRSLLEQDSEDDVCEVLPLYDQCR
jgi:hypothetical protein